MCTNCEPQALHDQSTGLSVLGWASYGGHPEVIDLLVRNGVSLDAFDGLFPAAQCDHHRFVAEVLARGVDPNEAAGSHRRTALHEAVQLRYTRDATRTVQVLLDAGADPEFRDADGLTPLELARQIAEHRPGRGIQALIERLQAVS